MVAISQVFPLEKQVKIREFETSSAQGLESLTSHETDTLNKVINYIAEFVFYIPKAFFSSIMGTLVLPVSNRLFFGIGLVADFFQELQKCFTHAWNVKKPAWTFLKVDAWSEMCKDHPEVLKTYETEEIKIKTPDEVSLGGHFFKHKDFDHPNSRIMIVLTGNAEVYKTGFQLSWLMKGLYDLEEKPISFLAINYRGCDTSEGFPTRDGLILDAASAYHVAKEMLEGDESRVDLYGYSLGGTIAFQLKNLYPKTGGKTFVCRTFSDMIEESSFYLKKKFGDSLFSSSLIKVIQFASSVMGWNYNNKEIVGNIEDPTYVFYHKNDETVPFEHSLAKEVQEKHSEKSNYNIIELKDKEEHLKYDLAKPHLMTLDSLDVSHDSEKSGLDIMIDAYNTC